MAVGAVVGAALGDDDAADGAGAVWAGLAGAAEDAQMGLVCASGAARGLKGAERCSVVGDA